MTSLSTSVFLAQAFGIYFAVMAIAMLVQRDNFIKMVAEIQPASFTTFVAGAFTVILGIILVLFHNVWVMDFRVFITILAWITLLKGAALMMYPSYIDWVKKTWTADTFYYYWSVILLFALVFLYKGYCTQIVAFFK